MLSAQCLVLSKSARARSASALLLGTEHWVLRTFVFNTLMPASQSDLDAVKQFLSETTRAILITYRKDGGIQSSPMAVVADDEGNVLLATRGATAKVRNLERNPTAALCLITERFLGPWISVEGTAEIERLPEALPALADFYKRRGSDDTSTAEWKNRIESEGRVLIRVRTERVILAPTMRQAASASR